MFLKLSFYIFISFFIFLSNVTLCCSQSYSLLQSKRKIKVNKSFNNANRAKEFNILDFGAKGDGTTFDTVPIKKAIDAVKEAGSGTIYFPKDRIFLTGPFNLTSHCTLYIEKNTTLLASYSKDDFEFIPALPSYGEGKRGGPTRRISLIHGENLTDIVITGNNGTIDGNGKIWWENKVSHDTPPHVMEFIWSSDIEISYVTVRNSPFWTIHPVYCDYFRAHDLWILNPTTSKNTDGIDIDSTRNADIYHVYIDTEDDGIAIKSGWDEYGIEFNRSSANISIRDSIISSTCAAIAIGSEMSGGVQNVSISNSFLHDSTAGIHIKSGPGRGGYVLDIKLENLTLQNCYDGIMIDTDTGGHPADTPGHQVNLSALPNIENIIVQNIDGQNSVVAGKFISAKEDPIKGVFLKNLHFNEDAIYKCGNVSGSFDNVHPLPCDNLSPVLGATTPKTTNTAVK